MPARIRGSIFYPAQTYDAVTTTWKNAVVTNGGTVSTARMVMVDTFVAAEKAAGTWAKTDEYWIFAGENAAQALTSLKQARLATAVSSPTFTANKGYAGDGLASYVNTGFVPSTNCTAAGTDNARIAFYVRNNVNTSGYAGGGQSGSSRALAIRPRNASTNFLSAASSNGATFSLPSADSRGYSATSRNAAAASGVYAYKNGAALTRTVDPTTFGAIPAHALMVGAFNNVGTVIGFSTFQVAFSAMGGYLSASEEAAQYQNVQNLMSVIGAGV